ncbi:DNRLRE domain-containing protein [Actinosynnema sp. NPDC023794]
MRAAVACIAVAAFTASALTAVVPVAGAQAAPARVDTADPVAAAKRKAKETGQRIVIESLREEKSTTWANPDGVTLHSELTSTPVRVRKNGTWTPIDTTLVEESGVVRPKATKGVLVLPSGGSSDLVAKHDRGTSVVRWPGELPKPRLEGDTATYRDALAPGADLVVTATATGFEQRIVLRERPKSPPTFRVPVTLPKSFRYDTEPTGRTRLLDATGEQADLSHAAVLDAQAAAGDADGGHRSSAMVSVDKDGAGPVLAITPDAEFLKTTATYPVTVAVPSDWVGLGLDEDTFVSSAQYPNSQASATWLRAGKSSNGTETWRTYVRFVVNGTELDGAKILNADLRMWNYRSNDCGDAVGSGIVARRITSAWNPATLTWNAQPSTTTAGQAANRAAYSDTCSWGVGELYYSVETIVQEWASGAPDHGLQLRAVSESDATNWRQYRSSEYTGTSGRGPVLFVDYEPARQEEILSLTGGIEPGSITYEQAVASRVGTPEQESAAPAVDLDQAREIQKSATQGYGPGEENSRPDVEEDWSEVLPGCGGPQAPECFPAWEGDQTPPAVTATGPVDGATGVPVTTTVSATFDEPVSGAQVVLRSPAADVVPGSTSTSGDRMTVTFVPAAPLAAASRHTVELSGAADDSGNVMTPHGWSFTTADQSGSDPVVITLPLRSDGWIDTDGSTDFDGDVLWAGVFDAGDFRAVERTYLRFDTSALEGKTVVDARLELRAADSYGCGTEGSGIVARRITGDWSETSLWWGDQPTATDDGRALATDPSGCGNDPTEDTWTWQIGDLARAWASGQTDHGLVLHSLDESATAPLYDHGWQSAETGGQPPVLTVTYVDPPAAATQVSAQAPPKRKHYQHTTFEECDKQENQKYVNLETGYHREGWVKNSFGWCAKSTHVMTYWKIEWNLLGWRARKVGEASYVFTVLITTFTGGRVPKGHTDPADAAVRTIYAKSRISHVWKFNKPEWDNRITVTPGWNATGCDNTSAPAPARTLSQLAAADTTVVDFTFYSDEAKATNDDRSATCTLKPFAEARNLGLLPMRVRGAHRGEEPVVRCDTSPHVTMYWGGCILTRSLPRMVVSTAADVKTKPTGSSTKNLAKEYAEHINTAFTAPDSTKPTKPGGGKRFPGNGAPNEFSAPLTRSTDPTVENANRGPVESFCKSNWTDAQRKDKECDEYPPAKTHQGAASPDWDYSVLPIHHSANESGGARQNVLWMRYRVLDKDPFKIWVTTSDIVPDKYISGTD